MIFFGLLCFFSCEYTDDNVNFLDIKTFPGREKDFSLWQLDQFDDVVQMGYIIKTDDDSLIVVDGGGADSVNIVEDYLVQLGGKVDAWIITHPHEDHAGVLIEVLKRKEIIITKILHSALNEEWVRLNEMKSYSFLVKYNKTIKNSEVLILDVKTNDIFSIGNGVDLKVIGDRNEWINFNPVNNSSLVFKIMSENKSILFLGDLGVEGGDEILRSTDESELKVDYVQMAHHGQNGVNKNFYEAIQAEYTLWPTPIWLWENRIDNGRINSGPFATLIVRQWMDDLLIKKYYVSGIEGNIQID